MTTTSVVTAPTSTGLATMEELDRLMAPPECGGPRSGTCGRCGAGFRGPSCAEEVVEEGFGLLGVRRPGLGQLGQRRQVRQLGQLHGGLRRGRGGGRRRRGGGGGRGGPRPRAAGRGAAG